MAYAPNTYTTNGTDRDYNITFPFLRESDVRVTVFDASGNLLTDSADYDFSIQKPDATFQVRVVQNGTIGNSDGGTALASGSTVTISRVTDISTLVTVFQDGASLRASDINAIISQINFALEEFGDNTTSALGKNITQTAWDAKNLRVTNLATPTADNDALRKVDLDSGIGSDITTVASIAANVTSVAADAADIGTVAANLNGSDTIGTVAGISSAVPTVAGISSAVTGVNTISANVTAVANDEADIGTVAADLSGSDTIGTVATNIANVNALAPQASNIGTLTQSANLTALQNAQANAQAAQAALATFLNKYHGVHTNVAGNDAEVLADIAGDSALTLEEGDLYFDSTNDKLRVYDGSAWQNAASVNVINTSTLSAVGDVAAYSNLQQNDFVVRGVSEWENASPTAARQALGLGTAATQNVDDFATGAEGDLASSALQPGDIINNLTSTSTVDVLSAAQGKTLNDTKQATITTSTALAAASLTTVTDAGNTVDVRRADRIQQASSTNVDGGATLYDVTATATLTLSDLVAGDIVTVFSRSGTTTIARGTITYAYIDGDIATNKTSVTVGAGTLATVTMVSSDTAIIAGSDLT